MLDVNFSFSFDFVRASQSRINTVACTPGCLSAYRRDIVTPVLPEWLNQRFLGLPAKIGEDRALTNLILRAGFHVHFQSEAVVYTKVPTRYKPLCRMMLRWARSNVRETLILTGFAFRKFRPTSALGARVNLLSSWLSMTVGEVFKVVGVYLLLLHPLTMGVNLLVGTVLSALAQAAFYALRYRTARCLWAFPYAVLWIFALSWISLYAWFTPQKSAWLTRGLDRPPLLPVPVQASPSGSR
jgi:hyaluronan synthase